MLPFRRFIASSISVPSIPFGRLLGRSYKPVMEETPIGGLVLHWVISTLMILATAAQKDINASYRLLVLLYSYGIDALFGFMLGGGLLFLRFSSSRKGALKSKSKSKSKSYISVVAAVILTRK